MKHGIQNAIPYTLITKFPWAQQLIQWLEIFTGQILLKSAFNQTDLNNIQGPILLVDILNILSQEFLSQISSLHVNLPKSMLLQEIEKSEFLGYPGFSKIFEAKKVLYMVGYCKTS